MAPPRPIPDLEGEDAIEFEESIREPSTKRHKKILKDAINAFNQIQIVE